MISVEKLFMIWKKIEWIRNDFMFQSFVFFTLKFILEHIHLIKMLRKN